MHRRLTSAAGLVATLMLATPVFAQPGAAPTPVAATTGAPAAAPEVAATTATTDASDEPAARVPAQELGARLGLAGGGRVTPGGLYIGGTYLYRLTDADWFETGVAFSFGGGDPGCFRDRDNATVCDQGIMSGFAGELSAGMRRYFLGQGKLTPYARAGVSLRVVNFGDDDLKGLAVPLWLGGGVRAEVAKGVHVMGDASLHAGPALMGKRLGLEPQIALIVSGGVEFEID